MKTTLYILMAIVFITNKQLQAQTSNFKWVKNIGDTAQILVKSIVTDTDGNVYTAGTFTGVVDFNPDAGINSLTSLTNSSAFISKLDSNGNFIWVKKIGGSFITTLNGMAISSAGDLYLTGSFYGTTDFNPSIIATNNVTSVGGADIYILKLSSAGAFVWVRAIGDNGNDVGTSIKMSDANEIYVTGDFEQTVDFNFGAGTTNMTAILDDAFVLKVDASGNFMWAKKLGGSGYEEPIALSVDHAGNVYTIGSFDANIDLNPSASLTANFTSNGQTDIYISKLDASGNFAWGKRIGNSADNFATGIANDSLGNAYITGYFEDTLDFNPSLPFNNDLIADFIDVYVLKLSAASGAFVWVKQIGGGNFDRAYAISIDQDNNSYITGQFRSSCDFDPSTAVFNVSTTGNGRDLFVLKLSDAGNFIWVKATGGSGGTVLPSSMAIHNTDEVLVTGLFEGTVDFNDPDSVNLTATLANRDVFIYKLIQNSVSNQINEVSTSLEINVFPNPASGQLNIEFYQDQINTQIKLVDVFGKTIQEQICTGTSKILDVAMLSSGIYYLQVISNAKIKGTQKIIIE
jgi:hypothetical protein